MEQSRYDDSLDHFHGRFAALASDSSGPKAGERPALTKQEDGDGNDEGVDGNQTKQIGRGNVLAGRGSHGRLGNDRAECKGKIATHGRPEGQPREGELLETGIRDTANDRDKGRIDLRLHSLSKYDHTDGCTEEGLQSLDDVSKADGTGAETHHGKELPGAVIESHLGYLISSFCGKLGSGTNFCAPEQH